MRSDVKPGPETRNHTEKGPDTMVSTSEAKNLMSRVEANEPPNEKRIRGLK